MANCPDPGAADGPDDGMAHLTINPQRSRALTGTLALAGTDYYEVAFNAGTTVYRTSFEAGKTGRITIPPGTYANEEDAILFAGDKTDRTLLGVGKLTSPAGGVILSTTTSVTFEVYPLTNSITNNPATTTFSIDSSPSTATATINNITYPLFKVPKSDSVEASYTVKCTQSAGTPPYNNYKGVKINGTGTVNSNGAGLMRGDDFIGVGVTNGTITPVYDTVAYPSFTPTDCVGPEGKFKIEFVTGSEDGLTKITVAVPVSALSTVDSPPIWYIRGGLTQQLDQGAATNHAGGGILIEVGDLGDIHNVIEIKVQ